MALNVLILKGIQASGKSSWAKDQVSKNPGVYKRINKDSLREMFDCSHHTDYNEKFVLEMRDFAIVKALEYGKNVIVDDTNFEPMHEARIREIVGTWNKEQEAQGKKSRAVVEIKTFDISLEDAIERDKNRDHSVGEKVIRRTYNQFIKPKQGKVPENKIEAPSYNPDLPFAIICDLDGTLALLNGRDPYDASTCEDDLVNNSIALILESFVLLFNKQKAKMYGSEVGLIGARHLIFVSGRQETSRIQTQQWLNKNGFGNRALFMRPTGDFRKDAIIKQEIYEREIKGKYNILFVLDDRDAVVKMWRNQGLICLQCAEGDF